VRVNRARTLVWRWDALLGLSLIVFVVILVSSAWVGDDAYITLRTIDNWIKGNGLTWNTAERVAAYTHPLWMLLLSVFYAVTRDAFYTTCFISIAVTFATILMLVFRIASSRTAAILVVASLTLSKSFIDYSTSGLENPLTHFLIVTWFVIYLSGHPSPKKLFLLSLVAAFLLLNRMDAALIILPPMALAVFDHRLVLNKHPFKGIMAFAAGCLPIILWLLFSTFYYGFPLPNTYYAKLNTGIPQSDLVRSGMLYLLQSARLDPLAPALIAFTLVTTIRERRRLNVAIVLAILLYLLYVVRIGGDFMAGRFLTAPYLCALIILGRAEIIRKTPLLLWVWVALLMVGLVWPSAPIRGVSSLQCDIASTTPTDVSDERGCYFKETALLKQRADTPTTPDHGWARAGLKARVDASPIAIMGGVGMFGYFAGPAEYIVDLNALGNPLLARLPVPAEKKWRIGHFERLIPGGYLETLASGQNRICDKNLALYYNKLTLVTHGRLMDPERLKAIWEINTGQLDRLLRSYGAVATSDAALLCNAQAIVAVSFVGGPELRGYAISTSEAPPGAMLMVTLYWQGAPEIKTSLYSFVHIRNSRPNGPLNPRSGNEIWAQAEHMEPGGRLTTDYWPPQVYADQFFLTLPADMPPGDYFLEIGWFDPQSGEQLDPVDATMLPPLRKLWRSVLLPSLTVH